MDLEGVVPWAESLTSYMNPFRHVINLCLLLIDILYEMSEVKICFDIFSIKKMLFFF